MAKARSQAQQKAAGAALAARRGDARPGDLKGASQSMYESMSEKELEELASTKRSGKPERVADEDQSGGSMVPAIGLGRSRRSSGSAALSLAGSVWPGASSGSRLVPDRRASASNSAELSEPSSSPCMPSLLWVQNGAGPSGVPPAAP